MASIAVKMATIVCMLILSVVGQLNLASAQGNNITSAPAPSAVGNDITSAPAPSAVSNNITGTPAPSAVGNNITSAAPSAGGDNVADKIAGLRQDLVTVEKDVEDWIDAVCPDTCKSCMINAATSCFGFTTVLSGAGAESFVGCFLKNVYTNACFGK